MADKVYIEFSTYQDLISGTNIIALLAVIEEIKQGKIYILTNEGIERRITVDENDNLTIAEY